MQDAWVRIIEFKDKLGEMYVHRLLKLEPELQDILKPLDLSKIGDEFFEIMDTVRLSHVSTHTCGSHEIAPLATHPLIHHQAINSLDPKGFLSPEALLHIKNIGVHNSFANLPATYYRSVRPEHITA